MADSTPTDPRTPTIGAGAAPLALADEVLRLDGEATPGPWEHGDDCLEGIVGEHSLRGPDGIRLGVLRECSDVSAAATYRTAAPRLAHALKAATGEAERLRAEVGRLTENCNAIGAQHDRLISAFYDSLPTGLHVPGEPAPDAIARVVGVAGVVLAEARRIAEDIDAVYDDPGDLLGILEAIESAAHGALDEAASVQGEIAPGLRACPDCVELVDCRAEVVRLKQALVRTIEAAGNDLELARLRRRVDDLERALAEEESAATRAGELMEEAQRGEVRAAAERDTAKTEAAALRVRLEGLTGPEMRERIRAAACAALTDAGYSTAALEADEAVADAVAALLRGEEGR